MVIAAWDGGVTGPDARGLPGTPDDGQDGGSIRPRR